MCHLGRSGLKPRRRRVAGRDHQVRPLAVHAGKLTTLQLADRQLNQRVRTSLGRRAVVIRDGLAQCVEGSLQRGAALRIEQAIDDIDAVERLAEM